MVEKMTLVDYDETMADYLRHSDYAAGYLEECLATATDEPRVFLRALREVVQAQSSMSDVARRLHASRPQLYNTLSEEGSPTITTIVGVLAAIGLRLSVVPVDGSYQ